MSLYKPDSGIRDWILAGPGLGYISLQDQEFLLSCIRCCNILHHLTSLIHGLRASLPPSPNYLNKQSGHISDSLKIMMTWPKSVYSDMLAVYRANAAPVWLSLTPHEWAWPPAVPALPSEDGSLHTGQTQAAPRIQTGARRAACSENNLLTVPKAQAMTVFLACRKTCWDGTNPNIWKRNMRLETTPDNRWLKGVSTCYISDYPPEAFTHPTQEQNQHPSHNVNIWSKILEKKRPNALK